MEQIMCEMCGLKPATMYYKQTINGITAEKHLCADCAEQIKLMPINDMFNPAKFIASIFDDYKPQYKLRVCKCGTTEQEILKNYKFGCAECYNTFKDIAQKFKNNMAIAPHKGKSPKMDIKQSQILALEAKLQNAVQNQNYEEAAKLQKQILDIKNKEGKNE
ncbi:MAG: UvrB/UvrC motif-containing protein [Clostridia bacterium]